MTLLWCVEYCEYRLQTKEGTVQHLFLLCEQILYDLLGPSTLHLFHWFVSHTAALEVGDRKGGQTETPETHSPAYFSYLSFHEYRRQLADG